MEELATWVWLNSTFGTAGSPTNKLPTYTEIVNTRLVTVSGSYATNQLVRKIDCSKGTIGFSIQIQRPTNTNYARVSCRISGTIGTQTLTNFLLDTINGDGSVAVNTLWNIPIGSNVNITFSNALVYDTLNGTPVTGVTNTPSIQFSNLTGSTGVVIVINKAQQLITNSITVGASMQQGSGRVTVQAYANYPVVSNLTIGGSIFLQPSGQEREFVINMPVGFQLGSTVVDVSVLTEDTGVSFAYVNPLQDNTYFYEIGY